MIVHLSRLSNIYIEILRDETNLLQTAQIIGKTRKIREFPQIGHAAKKSEEDVKCWDRLTKKHKGLRCGKGYDKPINENCFSSG